MKLALWPTQLALGVEPPTRHVDRQNVASSAEVSRARAEKAPLQRGVTLGVAEAVGGPVLDGVAVPVGVPVMVELAVPVTVLEEVAVRVWLPDWVVLPVCVKVGVLVAVTVGHASVVSTLRTRYPPRQDELQQRLHRSELRKLTVTEELDNTHVCPE